MKRICTFILLTSALMLSAQEDCPFGKPEPPKKPDIKEIKPGIFQIGTVRLEKPKREIFVPVSINQNEGPMEYLVVTGKGKTHESLLVTSAEPFHIQVAMLLMDCKGSNGRLIPEDANKPIPGEPVEIELRWNKGKDKKPMKARIESFVQRTDKKSVKPGPFIFNGSRVFDGTFLAQRDGSIVSLITDNAAQFNNPRKGRDDDEIWRPQPKGLPPLDSNATLVIRVVNNAKQK